MGELFDDVSRILASPMPRRSALKLVMAVVAGSSVAAIWPISGSAAGTCSGTCTKGFTDCGCTDPNSGSCCDPTIGDLCCGDGCCKAGLCCESGGGSFNCCQPGEICAGFGTSAATCLPKIPCTRRTECRPGSTCCGGKCCPPGHACSSFVDTKGRRHSKCCPPGGAPCGDKCCGPHEVCSTESALR